MHPHVYGNALMSRTQGTYHRLRQVRALPGGHQEPLSRHQLYCMVSNTFSISTSDPSNGPIQGIGGWGGGLSEYTVANQDLVHVLPDNIPCRSCYHHEVGIVLIPVLPSHSGHWRSH